MTTRAETRYLNSLSERVARVVCEIGECTLVALGPMFPDANDDQLSKALTNARRRQLVRVVRAGGRWTRAVWGPPAKDVPPPVRYASVWDYGQRSAQT